MGKLKNDVVPSKLVEVARDITVAAISHPSFRIDPNVSTEQLGTAVGAMFTSALKEIASTEL